MTIAVIGKHTVSVCPYCDKLLTVDACGEEGIQGLTSLLQEHLKASPPCDAQHQKSVRIIADKLMADPMPGELLRFADFLRDVLSHEATPVDPPAPKPIRH